LLLVYIILQITYVYLVGEASQSNYVMSYHSGFNLVWGRSNYTAAVLAYLSIIVFSTRRYWVSSYVNKIIIFSSLFIALIGIIAIISRGTILALFAGLISILIIYRKHIIKSWYWIIGISTISLIGGWLVVDFIIKTIERFKYMKFDLSFLTRLYMYKDLLTVLKNNIFIGVGPEQYRYTDFYSYQNDPHNIFLSYGIPFGIGGIILISLILIMPFAKLYKTRKSQAQNLPILFFLPAFMTAVVHSLVEPTITAFGYGMLFWTMYALMFRYIKVPNELIGLA
jgi:O-antigen ligase